MRRIRSLLLNLGFEIRADSHKLLSACKGDRTIMIRNDYTGYKAEVMELLEELPVKKNRYSSIMANEVCWWIQKQYENA